VRIVAHGALGISEATLALGMCVEVVQKSDLA
jgi:hypothetical protein